MFCSCLNCLFKLSAAGAGVHPPEGCNQVSPVACAARAPAEKRLHCLLKDQQAGLFTNRSYAGQSDSSSTRLLFGLVSSWLVQSGAWGCCPAACKLPVCKQTDAQQQRQQSVFFGTVGVWRDIGLETSHSRKQVLSVGTAWSNSCLLQFNSTCCLQGWLCCTAQHKSHQMLCILFTLHTLHTLHHMLAYKCSHTQRAHSPPHTSAVTNMLSKFCPCLHAHICCKLPCFTGCRSPRCACSPGR